MNTYKHIYYCVAFCAMVYGIPNIAHAAQIYLSSPLSRVSVNERVSFGVYLNTVGDSINAVEGVVHISSGLVCDTLSTASSIFTVWVQQPKTGTYDISFSGGVPGGFDGAKGELFSLSCIAKKNGTQSVSLKDMLALVNDGKATGVDVQVKNISILVETEKSSINDEPSSTNTENSASTSTRIDNPGQDILNKNVETIDPLIRAQYNDKTPPDMFDPIISIQPDVYENRYFMIFSTQDKETGVAYYEVAEVNNFDGVYQNASWIRAISPYVLSDQSLSSTILVRAVDGAGNQQIVTLDPIHPQILSDFGRIDMWIGTIILFLVAGIGIVVLYKKYSLVTKK